MPLAEATLEYWKRSQHVCAMTTQADREVYSLYVINPELAKAPEQDRIRFLTRLNDFIMSKAA